MGLCRGQSTRRGRFELGESADVVSSRCNRAMVARPICGPCRTMSASGGHWCHIGHEALSDHVTMTAAGLAFYSLLGIVPVLAALAALFGLVASPATVRHLLDALRGFLPTQAVNVLENSLRGSGSSFGLGLGLAISLCITLWTAQWASSGLIAALNIAFDTAEQRRFVHRQIVALVVAIGGIALIYLAIVIVALLPAARSIFALNVPYPLLLSIRWPLLALLFMLGLSTLYSHAPNRPHFPLMQATPARSTASTARWAASRSFYSGSI